MGKYNKVTADIVAQLELIVGKENVFTNEEKLQECSHDEVTDPHYIYASNGTNVIHVGYKNVSKFIILIQVKN